MTLANQGYVPVPLTPVASGRDILSDLERAHRPPTIQFVNPEPVVRTQAERKAAKKKSTGPKLAPRQHAHALWPALVREHGKELREAYEAGATTAALSERYGVDRRVVRKALRSLEVKMRDDRNGRDSMCGGVPRHDVTVERVMEMRATGATIDQMAAHFGVNRNLIKNRISKARAAAGNASPQRRMAETNTPPAMRMCPPGERRDVPSGLAEGPHDDCT